MNWESLKFFGANKFVTNTSIFLVLLPLIFKLKISIEEIIKQVIKKEVIFELPFTWQILFFAAIFFSAATILFRAFCPTLILKYNGYGEYQVSGKHITQLYGYLENIESEQSLENYLDISMMEKNTHNGQLPKNFEFKTHPKNESDVRTLFNLYSNYYYQNKLQFTYVVGNQEKTNEKHQFLTEHIRNLFFRVYEFANTRKPILRFIIFVLYLVGSILVAYSLFENIKFVIQNVIGTSQ